jgi:fucose permease
MSGFAQMGVTPLLPELGAAYGLQDSAVDLVHSVQLMAAAASVPLLARRTGTGG